MLRISYRIESLDQILKFYKDHYKFRPGAELIEYETFVDPLKAQVVFKLVLQEPDVQDLSTIPPRNSEEMRDEMLKMQDEMAMNRLVTVDMSVIEARIAAKLHSQIVSRSRSGMGVERTLDDMREDLAEIDRQIEDK
jgi:hypothetical protein